MATLAHRYTGGKCACADLGITKEAYWGAARSAVKALYTAAKGSTAARAAATKAAPEVASTVAKAPGPIRRSFGAVTDLYTKPRDNLLRKITPYGEKLEGAVAGTAGKYLGSSAGSATANVVKGVARETASSAMNNAAIFGLLEGGLGAATAEEGQRGEAFMSGLGHGALSGAAFGTAMGGFGKATKNIRSQSLGNLAAKQGLTGAAATGAVKTQMGRGFTGSLKDAVTGKGALGAGGSWQNVGGGVAQLGSEMVLPLAILPVSLGGGHALTMGVDPAMFDSPDQPTQIPQNAATQTRAPAQQQYPQYPQYPKYAGLYSTSADPNAQNTLQLPARMLTTVAGSAATGIPIGIALDAIAKKPWFPTGTRGSLITRTGLNLGSVAGLVLGDYVGGQVFPDRPAVSPPPKLAPLDLDQSMRYHTKREADHV